MSKVSSETRGFQGLRVVAFESRNSEQIARLIEQNGGRPLVAPSMREVPLGENREVLAFGQKLMAGQVDIVLFLTGIGTATLFQILETTHSPSSLREAFLKIRLLARGPKPLEALRQRGLSTVMTINEPGTWRDILETLDQQGSLQGKTVAVQESGVTNKELTDGLAARGARVLRVPVYRWALPENLEPLRQALKAVIGGQADIVLFTNSHQINHVLQFAQEEGLEKEFRSALAQTVVASVGPICTQFLDEYGVPVDLEPEHPKMANLVEEASRKGADILGKKRRMGVSEYGSIGVTPLPPYSDTPTRLLNDSAFMKACRREPTSTTPIWLMRQAGRYMKEYRDIRARHSFLDLCKDSDLACEVSVYAVERLGVDAAIIFSDILLILEPMGLHLEYAQGDGPVIHNPVRTVGDIERLRTLQDPEPLGFVYEAIRKTRHSLPPNVPLIGFSGAPFTLASYMIEGRGSRNFIQTKSLMYQYPEAWKDLMTKIVGGLIVYLNAQIAAGAQAVQLFDSWVGCLSPEDYRRYALPYSRQVIQGITPGTPVIHFGTQTGTFLELIKEAGGDVIGLDWRVELDQAWQRLGPVAVQGNLDPVALFAEPAEIRRQAKRILDQAAGRPGHIFNLGHGVLPNTPVGHVKALVDAVHEYK